MKGRILSFHRVFTGKQVKHGAMAETSLKIAPGAWPSSAMDLLEIPFPRSCVCERPMTSYLPVFPIDNSTRWNTFAIFRLVAIWAIFFQS